MTGKLTGIRCPSAGDCQIDRDVRLLHGVGGLNPAAVTTMARYEIRTGMSDFTVHKDEKRKQRYLSRHKSRENWNAPMTAGALSRWILWNKTTRSASIRDYKNRFNYTEASEAEPEVQSDDFTGEQMFEYTQPCHPDFRLV